MRHTSICVNDRKHKTHLYSGMHTANATMIQVGITHCQCSNNAARNHSDTHIVKYTALKQSKMVSLNTPYGRQL